MPLGSWRWRAASATSTGGPNSRLIHVGKKSGDPALCALMCVIQPTFTLGAHGHARRTACAADVVRE